MNQTFSIKRFLHYTRFCLTYNLGLILMCVSLMALSALCSLTGAHKYVVFVYMAMISILFCMFLPMYSKYANAYSGCKTIEFLVPASLLEKYVVKNALAVLNTLLFFPLDYFGWNLYNEIIPSGFTRDPAMAAGGKS